MKRINLIVANIVLCAFLMNSERSSAQSSDMVASQAANKHHITSVFNKKTYQLCVSLPKKYSEKDTLRYPVLFVLDGRFSFTSMNSIRDVLDLGKEIKDVIIVSIDDSLSSHEDWIASRYGDFTPSCIPKSDTLWSKIMNVPEEKMKSGNAEKFLNALEKELIPYIDVHYKTTTDRGLWGHSLGGLFAGYCLLKRPELFTRYGINSPSFWWNNKEMLQTEQSYAKEHTELKARVFFSVGGLEDPMMLSSFDAFVKSVKNHNYEGLSMTVKIFDGESHLSVVPACSSRTLKVLYGFNVQ